MTNTTIQHHSDCDEKDAPTFSTYCSELCGMNPNPVECLNTHEGNCKGELIDYTTQHGTAIVRCMSHYEKSERRQDQIRRDYWTNEPEEY